MQALKFEIHLLEPVLAGQAQSGEENSSIASAHIPGSMIRGALIGRYLKASSSVLDAGDPQVQALFFDSTLRYLNAYPLHPRRQVRMLPTPFSWYGEKDRLEEEGASLWDAARVEPPDAEMSPKRVPDAFCWWPGEGEAVQFVTPARQQLAHNFSLERNRKAAGQSGVFRYEALAPGQRFAGAIVAVDDERGHALLAEVEPLLAGRHFLGGSHTGGYGAVAIENVHLDTQWQEYTPSPLEEQSSILLVTLLSDAILRKEETGELMGSLHEWLGESEPASGPSSFHRLTRVGGFNRKWGLPLPQVWAVEAGGVFLFRNSEALRARLDVMVESGIGERQAEGFGRIAVHWLPKEEFRRSSIDQLASPDPTVRLSTASSKMLNHMVERQLEQKVDEWLSKTIAARARQLRLNGLKATQLSRARLAARRSWHEESLRPLQDFFEGMTRRTEKEWRKARVDEQRLQDWITSQLTESATRQPIATADLPQIGGVRAEWSDRLRTRTTARLIEGVLRRAVRKAKLEQDGQKEAQDE